MSRKATDPVKREEQARKYREMVAPYLGGEFVEAVGAFERFEWWDWGDSDIGWIISIFTRKSDERKRQEREGGLRDLPEYFLLAVTEDRVRAFSLGSRYAKKVKSDIADFPREDVRISAGDDWVRVAVIELTEEGRRGRVEIRRDVLNEKKNPWAAEVVDALEAAGLSE
jgi:hypothetical protein